MGAIKERAPILEEKPEINLMHFGVKVRFQTISQTFLPTSGILPVVFNYFKPGMFVNTLECLNKWN